MVFAISQPINSANGPCLPYCVGLNQQQTAITKPERLDWRKFRLDYNYPNKLGRDIRNVVFCTTK